jgi:hypothetical protein
MTTEEFKKLQPECKDLEGEQLWNAMEHYMLRLQTGEKVIRSTAPFYKRYRLRWLFYRRIPNMVFSKGDHTSDKRCKTCKKGKGMLWFMGGKTLCPSGHEYIEEPNTSFRHRVYVITKAATNLFWTILDKIHLVRSAHESRYDMFGDEGNYVSHYTLNTETYETTYHLKPRKWWEHIFVKRR